MTTNFAWEKDKLYFLPLGGCGLFGANLTLYGFNGKWLMVDCGMGFPDDTMPSVDLLVPDITFLKQQRDNLIGCVLTHAHEDHIGALEYLWPDLKCPLYATPFTVAMIRSKFSEHRWADQVEIHTVPVGGEIKNLKPFHIRMIGMAHSIPESQSLVITAGNLPPLLHTGDWKLDATPCVGDKTDEEALTALGKAGDVLAVVGDSTNAMLEGHSVSEQVVQDSLTKLFADYPESRIFVTCFASNVARMYNIARAAEANGRSVGVSGRSLWRSYEVSKACGYLNDIPPFLQDREAMAQPREKSVVILTGSQGESRAAVARIARGEHPSIRPERGDVLFFSALRIPGNEAMIDRSLGHFWEMDVEIVSKQTHPETPVHVSGHPYRGELEKLYQWVKPKIAVPVHGEAMQMDHHADLAEKCGIKHVMTGRTGTLYSLCPEKGVTVLDEVPHGLLAVEGPRMMPVHDETLAVRRRITFNGAVVVSIVMDGRGNLKDLPQITALGLADENSEEGQAVLKQASEAVAKILKNLPEDLRLCSDAGTQHQFSEKARIAARKFFHDYCGKRPQTRVHLFV